MAKLVGFVLSTHMNADGGSCYPGVPTIARDASVSARTVRNALRELEASGLLVTVKGGGRRSGGSYTSNGYQATLRDRHELQGFAVSPAPGSASPAPGSASPAPPAEEGFHEDLNKGIGELPSLARQAVQGSRLPCGACGRYSCDCEVPF